MEQIQQKIRDYILSEFAFDRKEIAPDEDLLSQGILDSMGVMQLVDFIEANFNIQVTDEDIVPENFRSLETLSNLITRRVSLQDN